MLHSLRGRDREHGQIMILFALSLVLILVFASIVVDLGVLRNNRQILVNTFDAAALAGGTKLPVNGATEGAVANALVASTIQANYPGLPVSGYTISYRCLIGATSATPSLPDIAEIPSVCNPVNALGHTPTVNDFVGAGSDRFSTCNPSLGDKCNVVVITGSATTQYGFGGVVGITSGSTGAIQSASCNGPCGPSQLNPVDVVLIMDRTLSMSSQDIADIQTGASAVLSVFNPAVQRVALGTVGPSRVGGSPSAPALAACPSGSTSPLKNLSSPANQVYGVGNSSGTDINYFNTGALPGTRGDVPRWITVGFTGTDGATPAVTSGWGFNEAYSSGSSTNTSSQIWKAISCFYSFTQGTNLDSPIAMAQQYLNAFGRPGVKKGIILETDGAPQAGDLGTHYTCNAASNTATAAKSNGGANGIEIFTIGFGVGTVRCPYPNSSQPSGCSGTTGRNTNESASWSCQPVASLLQNMATDASHYFDAPTSATLINAFTQAATQLAKGGLHLVQPSLAPIVTSVSPNSGPCHLANSVTISGQFFTGAFAVAFGTQPATSFTVNSDTSITATSVAGTPKSATPVDITVTTLGGTSTVVSADRYTYLTSGTTPLAPCG